MIKRGIMKKYYWKYLILAIIGSVVIGLAFYLFLSNYLDREEIVIVSKDISAGEEIKEDDLNLKEYYKNSLPDNYLKRAQRRPMRWQATALPAWKRQPGNSSAPATM